MPPAVGAPPVRRAAPGCSLDHVAVDGSSAMLRSGIARNAGETAQLRDHRFFLVMAILAAATVFIGYFQTFYQKPLEPLLALAPSPRLAILIETHGALMSLYVLFYVLQTALVTVRRKALHMTLGWASVAFIPAMLVLGTFAVFYAAKLGHKQNWPDVEIAAMFNIVDVYVFAALATAAILQRAKREVHKRLMLLSMFAGLVPPAIARTPVNRFGIPGIAVIVFAFVLAGPAYDLVTRRRIHPAYLWALLFIFATAPPIRIVIGSTMPWHHFVDWVIR